ncbi:hypothetical protein KL86DYS2_10819 [uncultured Dysgonomonas sp.]|uniref:Uncharacterized protein n=1 Tax=uncultured Dysgonomonas sp. TaxID=206096 RepID=A0A212J672_9BACT|nr:hypothetical protein KL86DYS2_10819 [uncultured Dysgonomonas sp.]
MGRSNKFTQRINVLLPAPDSPIIPNILPLGTVRDIFDRAVEDAFFP